MWILLERNAKAQILFLTAIVSLHTRFINLKWFVDLETLYMMPSYLKGNIRSFFRCILTCTIVNIYLSFKSRLEFFFKCCKHFIVIISLLNVL